MNKVVVISAHPDDEILGVGGTMLRHVEKGDEVYWIIATDIYTEQGFSIERVNARKKEIELVAEKIGIKSIYKIGLPTMSLVPSSFESLIPKISSAFNEIQPDTIYCVNRSDAHSDHRILFEAVMACTKSFRYPYVKKVLMYECISETEFAPALPEKIFIPNYYVDITPYMEKKLTVMEIYESELGPHPFPRSLENIRALAVFRGASVGVQYAEAFQLIKFIDKD